MPFTVKCKKCEYMYYYGFKLDNIFTVLEDYITCPECGDKVSKILANNKFKIE